MAVADGEILGPLLEERAGLTLGFCHGWIRVPFPDPRVNERQPSYRRVVGTPSGRDLLEADQLVVNAPRAPLCFRASPTWIEASHPVVHM